MNSEQRQQGDDKELRRYIEGWLQCKKDKKFKRMWCVLKGQILGTNNVVAAYLFCFKDSNTHVREHFIGSYNIDVLKENVMLTSVKGGKHMKCEFDISLGESKLQFMADDNITRERWIYALVDLVGKGLPPSELPDLQNNIRPHNLASFSPRKSSRSFIGSIGKSKTLGSEPSKQWPSRPVPVDISNSGDLLNKSCDSVLLRKEMHLSGLRPQASQPPDGLLSTEWYHGPVSRDEALRILYREPVGTYFLRDCSSEVGSFTLTFKDSDKIKHHKIQSVGQSKYQFEDSEIKTLFLSPQEAVRFYMQLKNKVYFIPRPLTERGVGDGAEDRRRPEENVGSSGFGSPMFKRSNQYEYTPERRCTSVHNFMTKKSHSIATPSSPVVNPPITSDLKEKVSRTNSMPPRPRNQQLRPTLSKQKTVGGKMGSSDGGYVEEGTDYTSMGTSGQKNLVEQENEYLTGDEISRLRHEEDDERYLTEDQIETPYDDRSSYPKLSANQPSPTQAEQPIKDYETRKHSYVNEPLPEIPADDVVGINENYSDMYIEPKDDEDDSLYINQDAIEIAQRASVDVGPPPPIPPRTYNPKRMTSDTYVNI